jgi:hypothetical protein
MTISVGAEWPWPSELDSPAAAPGSHSLLLRNDRVRVPEIVIKQLLDQFSSV